MTRGLSGGGLLADVEALGLKVVHGPLDFASVTWTSDDIKSLCAEAKTLSVIALLDLCAAATNSYVSFNDVMTKDGRPRSQTRGDLAGFTRFIKSRFGRKNWPVDVTWGAGGDEQVHYRMEHEIAAWWREARLDSSSRSS